MVEQFWFMEAIGTNVHKEQTESASLLKYMHFPNTRGHIHCKFLWKEDRFYLPSNPDTCKRRTHALVYQLRQTPELLQIYDGIIKEQEQ